MRSTPSWNAIERALRRVARLGASSGVGVSDLNVERLMMIYEEHGLADVWAEEAAAVVDELGADRVLDKTGGNHVED